MGRYYRSPLGRMFSRLEDEIDLIQQTADHLHYHLRRMERSMGEKQDALNASVDRLTQSQSAETAAAAEAARRVSEAIQSLTDQVTELNQNADIDLTPALQQIDAVAQANTDLVGALDQIAAAPAPPPTDGPPADPGDVPPSDQPPADQPPADTPA